MRNKYKGVLKKKKRFIFLIAITTIVVALLSVGLGPTNISLQDIFKTLFGIGESEYETVIWNIRIPRTVAAILVGASLGLSGVVMQCVLNNPLASASTLGVSQAAAFGAAVGIIVFGGGMVTTGTSNLILEIDTPYIVTISAFVFSLISTGIIIAISKMTRSIGTTGLVLAGVAISSLFAGGSALLQYFADDSKISTLVFWTFGNLGNVTWFELGIIGVVLLVTLVFFVANSWNYNAMTSGDVVAKSLGVDTKKTVLLGMVFSSLIAAIAVSFVGIIGFIGIVAPHIVKRFIGEDYRYIIIATAIMGALVLLIADTFGRMVISPVVLPVGAVTSFFGAPIFLWVLLRKGRRIE